MRAAGTRASPARLPGGGRARRVAGPRTRLGAGEVVEDARRSPGHSRSPSSSSSIASRVAAPARSSGIAAKMNSHGETAYGRPGSPPTANTSVPSSSAIATRFTLGSRMKTSVPAGASSVSPSMREASRGRARRRTAPRGRRRRSRSRRAPRRPVPPTVSLVYALMPKARMPSRRRTGCQTRPSPTGIASSSPTLTAFQPSFIGCRSSSSTTGSIRSTRRRAPRGSRCRPRRRTPARARAS